MVQAPDAAVAKKGNARDADIIKGKTAGSPGDWFVDDIKF
jgi:hypothetical protein